MNGVSAILLAAGAGSRFGGGKLLADFEGRPLIEHALITLREAPVGETVVVVGPDAEKLREVCGPFGARLVENPDWEQGQSTSVKSGLRAMGLLTRAALVLLGDQPLVGTEVVVRLVAAFEGGAKVAVATYGGKRRNPALFSREVWPLLLEELSGDEGARRFMRCHPDLVVEVPCDEVGSPADVDTREDLRRLEGSRERVNDYKMG
jgi:molybdenum cofactor cytidylyltransferase